jgi:hypothetical protein
MTPDSSHDEILRTIKGLLAGGNKIGAIKYYRECVPGAGLKEAKEAVEAIGRGEEHQLPASARVPLPCETTVKKSGCGTAVLALMVALIATVAILW